MTENPSTEPVSPAEVPLAVTLAPAPTDNAGYFHPTADDNAADIRLRSIRRL